MTIQTHECESMVGADAALPFDKSEYLAQLYTSLAHESEQTREFVSLLSTSYPSVLDDLLEQTTIFKIKLLNLLRQALRGEIGED